MSNINMKCKFKIRQKRTKRANYIY